MRHSGWTYLTNHGHVLICLAGNPDIVLRDVADQIGITERAVQKIVSDLESAGAVSRVRVGRRNRYVVTENGSFRHPLECNVRIGDFVELVRCANRDPIPVAGA